MTKKKTTSSPLAWVPSLYFAEALPYMMVMYLSAVMYTKLGLSNTELALYTSWLYLPWVIKPLWSPIVDSMKTNRWWILAMQVLVGASLAGVALTLQMDIWLQLSLAFFWLMAFSSATHDIAADGYYIEALTGKEQAYYVGWRSAFYRVGTIFCQGGLVVLAGLFEKNFLSFHAWSFTMAASCLVMLLLAAWHGMVIKTPQGMSQVDTTNSRRDSIVTLLYSFAETFRSLFSKKGVLAAILFMLMFRFPEAQLAKMAQPFMLRGIEEGGLGLATEIVGMTYGTLGVAGLLAGGILGGWLVSKYGLKRLWWLMIAAISLPDAVYIYLAEAQPSSMWIVNSCVVVEQFGYGFGFTAYTLFMVYFAKGEKSTSVFSICTGLQALGMMLPGMMAGYLADMWGFANFFWWVMACCLVTVLVSMLVKIPENV